MSTSLSVAVRFPFKKRSHTIRLFIVRRPLWQMSEKRKRTTRVSRYRITNQAKRSTRGNAFRISGRALFAFWTEIISNDRRVRRRIKHERLRFTDGFGYCVPGSCPKLLSLRSAGRRRRFARKPNADRTDRTRGRVSCEK